MPEYHLKDTGEKTKKTGTFVRFLPDKTVFETTEFSHETINRRLKELAFLNKGLKIILEDRRTGIDEITEYQYNGGIVDFVK